MRQESLRELFIQELQELYSAENMILKALPKVIEKLSSPQLRNGFSEHLEHTRGHVRRLDQIFDQLGDVDRKGKKSKVMNGIIKEDKEFLEEGAEPEALDARMTAGAQRIEHHEIASYSTVTNYARLLGRDDWAQLLGQTLEEEKETAVKLNQLAEHIHIEAKAA
jgi:ferritin-like metal-binding protein YciE